MFNKILGLNNLAITPTEAVGTRGTQATQRGNNNFFVNGPTGGDNAFAQYDRPLEHGYAGKQWQNGVPIGGLLNFEA